MSETLCARCTVCTGKETTPCAQHDEGSCRHPDCGHYIPLDGRILCFKISDLVKPWIKAGDNLSKVRIVQPLPFLPPVSTTDKRKERLSVSLNWYNFLTWICQPVTSWNISGNMLLVWCPIATKILRTCRSRPHNHKLYKNYCCCSRFGFHIPDWLFPCGTISFQMYFWCFGFLFLSVRNTRTNI